MWRSLPFTQVGHHAYGKTAIREADGIRALGELLAFGQWTPKVQRQATAALMAVSVEKESKLPVVKHAGIDLVKLLKVRAYWAFDGIMNMLIIQ